MTIHAGSIEQFMLRRSMENEIRQQKELEPRWKGRMIFTGQASAAAFVTRMWHADKLGFDQATWRHARDIMALTHDFYCDEKEAETTVRKILYLLSPDNGTGHPEEEGDIEVEGNHEEITVSVRTRYETIRNHFIMLEGQYVPII